MAEGLLHVLSNPTNQAILSLLAVEPAYPRRIGGMLALSETEVARRLKLMEALGLVEGSWAHIGRNVKLYRVTARAVQVELTAQGLRVEVTRDSGAAGPPVLLNPFSSAAPDPGDFVGRARELAVLGGPEPVVVVEGMAGIGKTCLLASYAHQHAPDAAGHTMLWHSFRGVESLNWLANRFALFLAQRGDRALLDAMERGAELADKRELMLQRLDQPGVLILLDDAHRVEDEAVRGFLGDAIERTERAKLILAGREMPRFRPSPGRVRVLQLGGLDEDDVGMLLASKGIEAPAAVRSKLREVVGGHPLALALLVANAQERQQGLAEVLTRVPEQNLEDWLLREVDATLSEGEREVLVHASVFRTSFDLDDLDAVSRRPPEGALLALRRRLLIQARAGHEYALHEVVRTFFYGMLRNKRELHGRVAAHYLSKETTEGRLEALHHFIQAGQRPRVLALLEQDLDLREFDFIDAGYQNLYLGILELFARSEVPDPRRWALIEDEKGDIRFHRGEWQTALQHYEVAAQHFEAAKEPERIADLAWKRSMALQRLGEHARARDTCARGLKVAPEDSVARERLERLGEELRAAR
ncbi:MAG: hypothetical protein LC624_09515 [Halobacteriales archaeon]|nr:hypothetical protein [Halobacteriales archaeon]